MKNPQNDPSLRTPEWAALALQLEYDLATINLCGSSVRDPIGIVGVDQVTAALQADDAVEYCLARSTDALCERNRVIRCMSWLWLAQGLDVEGEFWFAIASAWPWPPEVQNDRT